MRNRYFLRSYSVSRGAGLGGGTNFSGFVSFFSSLALMDDIDCLVLGDLRVLGEFFGILAPNVCDYILIYKDPAETLLMYV